MTERKDTGLQLCGHNRKCSHRERRGHSGRSKARRAANRTAALWAGRDPCTACQELPRAPPFGAESAPLRTRKTLLCLRKGATGRRKKGGWHRLGPLDSTENASDSAHCPAALATGATAPARTRTLRLREAERAARAHAAPGQRERCQLEHS